MSYILVCDLSVKKVLECKRCLYRTDHPLGLTIDENGICSGCRVHEEKNTIDWNLKLSRLKQLTSDFKANNKNNYDCILPLTGSSDSYFVVHIVKKILGLNPLAVSYNHYFNTKLGIRNLSNLRTIFDLDIIFQNINPISVKKVTRATFERFNSIYWPVIAGQTAFPVQMAVTYKIPLVIWGAHQGLEQVGMFSHNDEVEMTRRYRKEHDLMGFEADDLLSVFNNLNESDIWQYRYPDDSELTNVGIRNIYLGNYFRWDPKMQHEFVIKNYNYKTTPHQRTFYSYDHIDCFNYMNLHDIIKYLKCGFSKVTDHITREIRHNRIDKKEGLLLQAYYQKQSPKYLNQFCEWLEIDYEGLMILLNNIDNNFAENYGSVESIIEAKRKSLKQSYSNLEYSEIKNILDKLDFTKENEININESENYTIFGKEYNSF